MGKPRCRAAEVNNSETPLRSRVPVRASVDAAGDTVQLRIEDDGPGIPDMELAVHDRSPETQLEHSTGVGPWLVQWVVSASQGDIDFETGESGGTTVRVRLTRPT